MLFRLPENGLYQVEAILVPVSRSKPTGFQPVSFQHPC